MKKLTKIQAQKAKRELSQRSVSLKKLLQHYPADFRPQGLRSPYESLIRAIAHQQLHGKAAETILGRFIGLYQRPGASQKLTPDRLTRKTKAKNSFPTPEQILKTSSEDLRKCGFSQSKVRSIQDIAAKAIEGAIPGPQEILKLSNDDIVSRLTQIYGVGPWTVEMLLIFQLGRMNVWPVDDFGIKKGFQIWKKKKEMPTTKELKTFENQFVPYQTVVALSLWRLADFAKTKKGKSSK